MAEITQTFSESWYRIAGQRISLRTGVNVRRQNFRGQRWIVLENPFNNQFFRLRPAAYEFIARLRPERTVEEVWKECMNRFPDEAPGQEAVIQLLSQLYYANLLQYEVGSDSAKLFERYQKAKQRETKGRLLSVMFIRFPLLDPDEFLKKTMPIFGKLISPIGALIWFIVIGWGLKMTAENWTGLRDGSQGVLAPQNLPLLYVGLVIVKTLHEFGHAYFTRKFGGEVHAMGVQFMIFTPTPYVDATSSWGFRSRWQRVLVGAAGMIVELFVAVIALFIWSRTSPNTTLHNLCYNMVFVASVSTLMFNLIPLLRFDGYYILSDLLDIPNLSQRAMGQLRHLVERYAFGIKKSETTAYSQKEAWWLTTFGITSGIYRVFVFGRILLFVADRLLLIGIIMAVFCAISWVLVPTIKLFKYLGSSPRLERCRPRAIAICATAAAVVLIMLNVVPFPHHFRASGVLEAHEWSQVVNETGGYVDKILVTPGAKVTKGQPLLAFHSPELELELTAAKASRNEVEARLLQAMKLDSASLKPLRGKLESVDKRITRLNYERSVLTVRARNDGIWVAPQIEDAVGRWFARGTSLGLIVNPSKFEFVASVLQEDVDRLFAQPLKGAEIRLRGQADTSVTATNLRRIPAEQHVLPSPALGWGAGGDIPIAKNDPQGQKAAEPFFEVRADVQTADVALLHGRAGKIRFDLKSEPLLPRWIRRLQQLLQKRYQI
jgi:putative peptide zinc metalloprotease protein